MKLSELKNRKEVLADHLADRSFRERWEKTALARAVALRLVSYRAEHEISQTELAKILGMKQPAVARLEAGEKTPTWETLGRISHGLGIEFLIDIAPKGRKTMVGSVAGRAEVVERVSSEVGNVVVAAT